MEAHKGKLIDQIRRRDRLARRSMVVGMVLMTISAGWLANPTIGAPPTPASPAADVAELNNLLTQHGFTADGIEIEFILATPEFFRITNRWQEAITLGADRVIVVIFTLNHHGALADGETIVPVLQLDGRTLHVPSEVRHLSDDGHHRSDALIFSDLPVSLLSESHTIAMLLPPGPDGARPTFGWSSPLDTTVLPVASASPVATPTEHDASTTPTTDRQTAVAERGAEVMPFDLTRTTHTFTDLPDGGRETVVANEANDTEQIALIQDHLRMEVERFSAGDFSDPEQIHGQDMPGLAQLEDGYTSITFVYEDLPNGGAIIYRTADSVLVTALHAWFAAQRSDHGHGHDE